MLRITNISKTYKGDIRALKGINLKIPRGIFGLLGPNGAGKSTLMRTIATLQDPDTGSIEFDGIDVLRDKTALRRVLGYLPQEFGAYPRTSVQTMLEHFAALKGFHKADRQRMVEKLLVKTNLWDDRRRSVDKLSGGMKQRYGIAQSMIGHPRLIIVDEPTAGLDPAERRRYQNLLTDIGGEVVLILSTHIVDDVADLCPRLAIMGEGRILREGSPDELTGRLKGRLWQAVVAREDLPELRAEYRVISTRIKNDGIEVRVFADSRPGDAERVTPELEDAYFVTLIEHGIDVRLD